MKNQFNEELEVAKKMALMAGDVMLKYFDSDQQIQKKANNSPVTIADTSINRMVIEELAKEFPDDGVIGEEESTSEYGMGRKWFCDPIDGTKAYIWGTPTAMFSLALVIDGSPILGVAYDPFLKKMYWAVRGQGSYCNDKKISVSGKGLEGGTIAVTYSPTVLFSAAYIPKQKSLGASFAGFSGCVYKCSLVARGKFEAYFESGVNGHDMAAVNVIVEEAGGRVTGLDGKKLDYSKPFKGAVVSNGIIHDDLVSVLSFSHSSGRT